MFELNYEPLSKDSVDLGRIALVPWDTETFGFGIADYQADECKIELQDPFLLRRNIETWATDNNVELIGTNVLSSQILKLCFLQSLGFNYIHTTLDVHYENVQSRNYQATKVTVLPAGSEDLDSVKYICGQAFENGRYHSDARMPRHLANRRYQDWASRTFAPENPQNLLVARTDNRICAFSIIDICGEKGRILLNAVEPQFQGQQIGIGLIASTLLYLKNQGVDFVLSNISAANIRAINMHSFLGARFYNPNTIFHWHAPWSTHFKQEGSHK